MGHRKKPISLLGFLLEPAVLLFILVFKMTSSAAETLIIVDDGYCPFMCDDKEKPGIYLELMQEIFSGSRHRIEQQILPFRRAIHLAQAANNSTDVIYMLMGVNNNNPEALTGTEPLSYHQACFYTSPSNDWRYTGANSEAARIGLIKDYNYTKLQDYIFREDNPNEIVWIVNAEPTLQLMRKTAARRIDTYLDLKHHTDQLIAQHNMEGALINAGCSDTPYPIIVHFPTNHPLTASLISTINHRVAELKQSGKLQAIYKKYNMPMME